MSRFSMPSLCKFDWPAYLSTGGFLTGIEQCVNPDSDLRLHFLKSEPCDGPVCVL